MFIYTKSDINGKMIDVKVGGVVNKPLKDLWKVSVLEFEKAGNWATGVFHSEKTPKHDRVCDTAFGKLYENISTKDEKNHYVEIDATGFPFFIKKAVGRWSFRKITDNKTEFSLRLKLTTIPILGPVMEIFMEPKLKKALQVTAEDYKTYLETGQISGRKEREKSKIGDKYKH